MTRAGGASSKPTAIQTITKKLRVRNGHVVIGEASGGYLQTSLDYTIKTHRIDNWARSFLNQLKNRKRERERGRKCGRLYQRLMCGIQFANYNGQRLRFMSLTSSPQSDPSKVNRHFEVLVKRIRRRFPLFEYCKIRTPEGSGGVIHCVFRGPFIPQSWLSEQWNEIHSAHIVDIRVLYGDRGIAS